MTDNLTLKPEIQLKSSTELLEMQTQTLANIYTLQLKQQERIDQLFGWIKAIHESLKSPEVKVADINMPFFSLVGFLVKLTLASIPAFIILAVLGGIMSLLFGGILSALSALFRTSR